MIFGVFSLWSKQVLIPRNQRWWYKYLLFNLIYGCILFLILASSSSIAKHPLTDPYIFHFDLQTHLLSTLISRGSNWKPLTTSLKLYYTAITFYFYFFHQLNHLSILCVDGTLSNSEYFWFFSVTYLFCFYLILNLSGFSYLNKLFDEIHIIKPQFLTYPNHTLNWYL